MAAKNYAKNNSNNSSQTDAEREQRNFSLRIENYVCRHPEFIEELDRRMAEDEISSEEKQNNSNSKYDKSEKFRNYSTKDKANGKYSGMNPLNLSEEDMERISGEISGLLFKKDESNKSFLEKKAEEAVSGMVYNYLSGFLKK